jgi:hypothetical protein
MGDCAVEGVNQLRHDGEDRPVIGGERSVTILKPACV